MKVVSIELKGRVNPEDIEFLEQTTGCEVKCINGQWVAVSTARKDGE